MSTSSISSTTSGTLSSLGIGSGLDVNSIISKLMSIESQPLNDLNSKKSNLSTQLSAYGQVQSDLDAFRTALSSLRDASGFSAFSTSSSTSSVASATASSSALTGPHSVTVNTLAQAQIQVGTNSYSSTSDALSQSGTLTLTQGNNSFSVTVDAGQSLQDISNSINAASDNTGVSASIMNDGSGYHLVLTAKNAGATNAITVSGDQADVLGFNNNSRYDSSGNEIDPTGSITQEAQDASLTVDGVPITKSSNTITDVIQGVSLQLASTGSTTINVTRDNTSITKAITAFTDAYNKLQKDITTLHQKGGTLEADSTVLNIQQNLQAVFNSPASISGNSFGYLAQVGISFQKDGSLAVDASALNTALNSNFDQVVSLFSDSSQGFATRLYASANDMLNSTGLITNKKDSINTQISTLNDQAAQMQVRLDAKQTTLQAQYTALDKAITQMKSTSSYLASQLSS